MIRYMCPRCSDFMESPEAMAGKMEKCQKCGHEVPVPLYYDFETNLAIFLRWSCLIAGMVVCLYLLFTLPEAPVVRYPAALLALASFWTGALLWWMLGKAVPPDRG